MDTIDNAITRFRQHAAGVVEYAPMFTDEAVRVSRALLATEKRSEQMELVLHADDLVRTNAWRR